MLIGVPTEVKTNERRVGLTPTSVREVVGAGHEVVVQAGAGAGIVGAGIGGPMADFFNALSPGLGYLVIFAAYGGLFLLSVLALTQVKDASTP